MAQIKTESKKTTQNASEKKAIQRYFKGIGRRKQSVAGAKLHLREKKSDSKSGTEIVVNKKAHKEYFVLPELREIVEAPLKAVSSEEIALITISVRGGGIRGQAEATRLGIARAMVEFNQELKKTLKDLGYLTRDSRTVERKKAGLKKARRAPQFSKR